MRKIFFFFIVIALVIVPWGMKVYACIMDVPNVREEDILNPPSGMLAFKGKIVKISKHGPIDVKPHTGFQMEFSIVEMFQGDFSDRTIKVEFGACHNMPGKIGDVILVLANWSEKEKVWYAPQFWTRSVPSGE